MPEDNSVTTDVIIIGSGIGGLSCAALLARYGDQVIVCESHTIPGGAAHGFEYQGYCFDSGPSLYSGMSYSPSPNPLKQVLDAIGEDIPWANYKTWGCRLPEGNFDTDVGADQFCEVLAKLRGSDAVAEWRSLQHVMEPLARAAISLPAAALRSDFGSILTAGRYIPQVLRSASAFPQLTRPFSEVMDRVIQDPFTRNWLDLLCFLLSGLPAAGTLTAVMAFMFADWYRPHVVLDYPIGGSRALVNALVRGLEKRGGTLALNAHVAQVMVKGNRAVGVRLRNGKEIIARKAVISNASIWDTLNLIPQDERPSAFTQDRQQTPDCDSFMHLHVGIDAQDLSPDLACHYIVVDDWSKGITTPLNVIVMSIPSVLDPGLAPPGKHVIHVYTPGNEPYDLWQGLDRRSSAYLDLKQSRGEALWRALERVIPDVRDRVELDLMGTPLTHERFLRRYRGTYGPALAAGKATFPGAKTPIEGLLCCGDSTFPGIGLPAVAASGMIAAHHLASVSKQIALLKEIGL
jgi:phytoene dehydrogenase-like protein